MAQSPVMDSNYCVQLTFKHNADELVKVKRMKREHGTSAGKNIMVLKEIDVTTRNELVFMPNTIEMAKLKKAEKGQFKTNVLISSKMTEMDIKRILVENFPFLQDKRFYCAAAVENRTRLDFHGEPRIWDGQAIKRKIKGNSALYIFADEQSVDKQNPKVSEQSTMKRSHDQITSVENETSEKGSHLHQTEGQLQKLSDIVAGVQGYVYETGQHGLISPVSHPRKSVSIQKARNAKDVVTGAAPTSSHSMPVGPMVQGGIVVAQPELAQNIISTVSDQKRLGKPVFHIADGRTKARHTGLPLVTHTVPHVMVSSTLTPQMSNLNISKAASLQLQKPVDVNTCAGERDQSAQTVEGGDLSQHSSHFLPATTLALPSQLTVLKGTGVETSNSLEGQLHNQLCTSPCSLTGGQSNTEVLLDHLRPEIDKYLFGNLSELSTWPMEIDDNQQEVSLLYHGTPDLQNPIFKTAPPLGQGTQSLLIDQHQGFNTVLPGSSTADTDIPVIAAPRVLPEVSGQGSSSSDIDLTTSGISTDEDLDSSEQNLPQVQVINADMHFELSMVPKRVPLQGGDFCRFKFKGLLPPEIQSGLAKFGDLGSVKLDRHKDFLIGESIPPALEACLVTVSVQSMSGETLGETEIEYFDLDMESILHVVQNPKLHPTLFRKLAVKAETSNGETPNSGNCGSTQPVQLLLLSVYAAAQSGAQQFLETILNSSTGRAIFYAYKDCTPLPEVIARKHGHEETAHYLEDITKRFVNERAFFPEGPQTIDWAELVAAAEAVQDRELSIASGEENHQVENDETNATDYFGDAETSSSDSSQLSRSDSEDDDSEILFEDSVKEGELQLNANVLEKHTDGKRTSSCLVFSDANIYREDLLAIDESSASKLKRELLCSSSHDSKGRMLSDEEHEQSRVTITLWNPSGALYIDMVLWSDSLREVMKRKLDDYNDFFTSKEQPKCQKRLLVYGQPGIKKSHFSLQIANDWSQQILRKFDLVPLIKLRDVSNQYDVPAILKASELLANDSNIQENQDKVLLIIDGFDESSYDEKIAKIHVPVHGIWQRKNMSNCFVPLTLQLTHELKEKKIELHCCLSEGYNAYVESITKEQTSQLRFNRPFTPLSGHMMCCKGAFPRKQANLNGRQETKQCILEESDAFHISKHYTEEVHNLQALKSFQHPNISVHLSIATKSLPCYLSTMYERWRVQSQFIRDSGEKTSQWLSVLSHKMHLDPAEGLLSISSTLPAVMVERNFAQSDGKLSVGGSLQKIHCILLNGAANVELSFVDSGLPAPGPNDEDSPVRWTPCYYSMEHCHSTASECWVLTSTYRPTKKILFVHVTDRKNLFHPESWFEDEDCELMIQCWKWHWCKTKRDMQEQSGLTPSTSSQSLPQTGGQSNTISASLSGNQVFSFYEDISKAKPVTTSNSSAEPCEKGAKSLAQHMASVNPNAANQSDDSLLGSDHYTDRSSAGTGNDSSSIYPVSAEKNNVNDSFNHDSGYISSLQDGSLHVSGDATDSSSMRIEENNGNDSLKQDSGKIRVSSPQDGSLSIDATGNSSMCVEENNGNERYVYQIYFPDYRIRLDCESTGKETILNMIKNRFKVHDVTNRKPNFENMLFMNSNNSCLNVGLPVGVLSSEETYICIFKRKLVWNPSDHRRQYAVDMYDKNWDRVMGYFFVSKDEISPQVSKFTKIIPVSMKVDFFHGETLFQALVRDGRFVEKELRFCGVKCDGKQSGLSYMALNYKGKSIQIYSMKQKNPNLPKSIQPRPYPDADVTNVKVEPREMQETGLAIAGPSTGAPQASSTPSGKTSGSAESQMSEEDLAHLIECIFESKSQKLLVKDKKKLVKECNFALKQGNNTLFVRLAEVLAELAKSVGVIFILNNVNCPELKGTCFRIGTQYIITNNHVMEAIENVRRTAAAAAAEVPIFVDFNFMEGETPDPYERRYEVESVPVVRSDELDYAILKMMDPPDELPPCIFKRGVSLMDPNNSDWSLLEGQCLRFIGHPNRQAKLIDPMCPVVTTPQDGLKLYVFTSRRGGDADKAYRDFKDQRKGKYHVSNFFHGSSGSPGILLLSGKKLLVILHTKGFWLDDSDRSSIEQGVLFTEIYKHVQKSIENAQQDPNGGDNVLKDVKLEDIFPSVEGHDPMDIDQ